MSFTSEFKEFAMKGNVVDLAVGVIIGAAFGKIVDSIVKDLIMPVIGRLIGGLDFSNYFVMLADPPPGYTGPRTYEALTKAGVPLFAYGNFITVAINFIILAFIIFLVVRSYVVPKSFGQYGHYRGNAITDIAAHPVKFAGHQACETCHSDEADTKNKGKHSHVNCEACHGALAKHADDPASVTPATRRRSKRA